MLSGGVYLFLGADRARKRERVEELAAALKVSPLDRHQLRADEVSSSTLLALVRQHPAASVVRFVVIDEAHRLDGASIKAVAEHREAIAKTACLVLLADVDLSASHPLTTLASQATVERFAGQPSPSPAKRHFTWLDAVARRDTAAALGALQEQLAAGKNVLELLGLLVWQLQRWLTVGHLLELRVPRERIEALTGLRAWQLQRTSEELADRSLASLRQGLRRCWELDVAVKTGRTIPRVALEELTVELCLPGRSASRQAGLSQVGDCAPVVA